MPAQPNTAIQLNYKLGGAMVNIYADTAADADDFNAWVVKNAATIAETQALLEAAWTVAAPQGPAPQQPASQRQQQVPQQAGAPQGDGGSCQHGAYVWKDFVSKAGNPVKGWFCPSQSRTDCPPKFAGRR